jgi:hypothetical protein
MGLDQAPEQHVKGLVDIGERISAGAALEVDNGLC